MYKVDLKTLEFDLSVSDTEEKDSLLELAYRGVREGYVNMEHPAFVVWMQASEFDATQGLLCYANVFIKRVLISFVDYLI